MNDKKLWKNNLAQAVGMVFLILVFMLTMFFSGYSAAGNEIRNTTVSIEAFRGLESRINEYKNRITEYEGAHHRIADGIRELEKSVDAGTSSIDRAIEIVGIIETELRAIGAIQE